MQAAQLARRESAVAGGASVATARTDALQVVATGDEEAVRKERAAQLRAKDKHEARLSEVMAAKRRLVTEVAQFKQQHPAAVAALAARAASVAVEEPPSKAVAATVAVLEEMRDDKLLLDADARRTLTLLSAVKVT